MKKFGIALAFALGLVAAPGYAVTVVAGGKNIPPPAGFATGSATLDLNNDPVGSSGPDGFVGGTVVNGDGYSSSGRTPYVTPFGDTTNYYLVQPSTPAFLLKKEGDPASGISQFSLYWGSIDNLNAISILGLGPSGVFSGASFLDGSIEESVSRLVTFYFTPAEGAAITGIEFSATGNAFEFDNVGLSVVFPPVPEPSSWLMMTVGFGLLGAALRRRNASTDEGIVT